MHYIYSTFFKYSCTSCLHIRFLGALGFHKCFSISPPFCHFHHIKQTVHLIWCLLLSSFHPLSSLSQQPHNITWTYSPQPHQDTKNTFQFCILSSIYALASAPSSCTHLCPISSLPTHFLVFPMLLILIGCHFLLVPININHCHQ